MKASEMHKLAVLVFLLSFHAFGQFTVIAHRGASGYLPEHTLAAYALAHGLGSDFIEPDVVLTKDGVPILLHDIHLESTTNVSQVFPKKKRKDGHWYAIDLTLNQIKQLKVRERTNPKDGKAVFGGRFPNHLYLFEVPTMEELIQMVQGLNKSRGTKVGLYPEIKSPKFHFSHKKDIAKIVNDLLIKHGYGERTDEIFIQSFDPESLRHLKNQLKSPFKLIQLIADNAWKESDANYNQMRTKEGLLEIAKYAAGIGPWIQHLQSSDEDKAVLNAPLVKEAHALGLKVHPYTLRSDNMTEGEFHSQLVYLKDTLKVDGVFTDFVDKVRPQSITK